MKKSLSIRARMLILFVGLALLLIFLYFIMNAVFWGGIYMRENESAMRSAYTDLAKLVREDKTDPNELKKALVSKRTGARIHFALQGESGWNFTVITQKLISGQDRDFLLERLQENLLTKNSPNTEIIEENENYTLQRVVLNSEEDAFLECYGYMENGRGELKHFILSMPLENAVRSQHFFSLFFLYISIFVLILGVVLSIIFTLRITKPVYQLTELSKRMKDLDFSARYTGNMTNEIGELGNNMNEMSEHLKKTISELQKANEQLSRDLEEKNQIDEMRRDFIASASHELKTPIALIQGYAEGLRDLKNDPESFAYYCDVIVDESDKMNRLVKKLTTLNQLEFGRAELTREPFDIAEMIRDIVKASAKTAEEAGVSVSVVAPESVMAYGDVFELEEVFQNYFSNALHYCGGDKKIDIRVREENEDVIVEVENTGEPIPEEEQEKIWVKFYKVDKARTRAYGGSGLGLSIVKAIMEAHQKEYGVRNTEDGVLFYFTVSRYREPV